jgi:phosphoribosylanthranilate isomerase
MKGFPLLKVCGITSLADATAAVEAGAKWLGFNFHPPSPRYLAPQAARAIVEQLPPAVIPVGIFVNRPHPTEVIELMEQSGMRIAQLHGEESPAYCEKIGSARVIKAFRVSPDFDSARIRDYPVWAILLDGYDPRLPSLQGGTGCRVDDSIAAEVARTTRLFLAGGLSPETMEEAIERVHPYAIDVNSGVESAPGIKDPARLALLRERLDRIRSASGRNTWEND